MMEDMQKEAAKNIFMGAMKGLVKEGKIKVEKDDGKTVLLVMNYETPKGSCRIKGLLNGEFYDEYKKVFGNSLTQIEEVEDKEVETDGSNDS